MGEHEPSAAQVHPRLPWGTRPGPDAATACGRSHTTSGDFPTGADRRSSPDEPPIFSIDWTELEQAIKQGFKERLGTSPSSPLSNSAAPAIVDGRWREVILPSSVVLILGKRGSGKSALAYRLLELFRYHKLPYVVAVPIQLTDVQLKIVEETPRQVEGGNNRDQGSPMESIWVPSPSAISPAGRKATESGC